MLCKHCEKRQKWNNRRFDTNARNRIFRRGDRVLVQYEMLGKFLKKGFEGEVVNQRNKHVVLVKMIEYPQKIFL